MGAYGFGLFDTAVGRCGVAWSGRGIAGVWLPAEREADTRAAILRRLPGAADEAMPPAVGRAVEGIQALLRGAGVDLSGAPLDMDGVAPFRRRVYEAARKVPAGATVSYGELAQRCGAPGAARAVGQALAANPFPLVVPCHRVVAADRGLRGFSAPGGIDTKARLLAIEAGGA